MTTTSRRLSRRVKKVSSHTPGRQKGENCQRTALKIFGAKANPYKLKGAAAKRFVDYSALVRGLNK